MAAPFYIPPTVYERGEFSSLSSTLLFHLLKIITSYYIGSGITL
jgi:hypothetical protein